MPEGRRVAMKTPLPEGKLLFRSLTGSEALGELFRYEIEVHSPDEKIAFEDLLGQMVSVEFVLADGSKRPLGGHVTEVHFAGRTEGYAVYRLRLHPWLWFLSRTNDCRVFQKKSVPDIVAEIFREHGFTEFEDALSREYAEREYTVQYRESDFAFVSRLMEDEGIYYFFRHEPGRHQLVLADAYSAHEASSGYETVRYFPPTANVIREEDHFSDWSVAKEVQSGAVVLRDFDFTRPRVDLEVGAKDPRSHEQAEQEVFDYPGGYRETGHGDKVARIRLEAAQALYERAFGAGNARGLGAGSLFTLQGHPRSDQNREYLIVRSNFRMSDQAYESGGGGGEAVFEQSIEVLDTKIPFRSAPRTPRPQIWGPQTAIVVGKSGEEIWTDEHGRIKVQFHWDRYGKRDENSSCWVRVAQIWAGKGWGGIHIPRIGQEVIVEFLEGNPDHPIVTGRVYNGDCTVPYALPDNQTQSGIKSQSSKGAGPGNFNEIRMEDKKGEEELYIQAEKNHRQLTKNDRAERVGNDRSLSVGRHKSESIGSNKSIEVGADHTETIGGNKTMTIAANHDETIGVNKTLAVGTNHTESIGSNMVITIGATLTETVGANYAETVGGAMQLTVGGALAVTIGGAIAETIGAAKEENVAGSKSVSVGGSRTETIGDSSSISVSDDASESVGKNKSTSVGKTYSLSAKNVAIVAEDQITLKAGSASITMKKSGEIIIDGKKVNVKASGDVVIKGSKIKQN